MWSSVMSGFGRVKSFARSIASVRVLTDSQPRMRGTCSFSAPTAMTLPTFERPAVAPVPHVEGVRARGTRSRALYISMYVGFVAKSFSNRLCSSKELRVSGRQRWKNSM
jgi:hypothetical protein